MRKPPPCIRTFPNSAAPGVYFKMWRQHINIWLLSSLIYQPYPTGSLCSHCPHSEDKCVFPRCQGKVAECQLVSVSPWLRLGHSSTTGDFLLPLLLCFLFDTLSFSITTTQMKPGHAPSEQWNRQLPLVALPGLTYKEIWGNSSNPKTAPVSHTPPYLLLFDCKRW